MHDVIAWAFWLSLLTLVLSLVLVPLLIVRMPADYFTRSTPDPESWRGQHPVVRWTVRGLKNAAGLLLLLAGLVMLVTPGQGLLTALVGFSLLDIPGKRRLEIRVLRTPGVRRACNALRRRAGQPPLQLPPVRER